MSLLIFLLKLAFFAFMCGVILLFIPVLLTTWSWALSTPRRKFKISRLLSQAAVEWAAILTLVFSHFRRPQPYHETPPLDLSNAYTPQQIPIIFVPSLHISPAIFNLAFWRLKKHYWLSLWPFFWKPFLNDPALLEDQLRHFIDTVLQKTRSPVFRIISFGTSRPIVSRVLARSNLACDSWIAISAPVKLSHVMEFICPSKTLNVYQSNEEDRAPDLLIRGEKDALCYPARVFGSGEALTVPDIGHFGCLLHSSTIRKLLKELS